MKAMVNRGDLLKAISAAERASSSKSSLPVLGSLLLTVAGDTMTVRATDLEISLTTSVTLEEGEDGAVAVPGKQFCNYVRAMPGAGVRLSLEDGAVHLQSGRSRYKLQSFADANEFPVLPTVQPKGRFTVNERLLAETLGRTLVASAKKDTRPVLCSVLWRRTTADGESRLVMVATDTHRLHKTSCPIADATGEGDVLLSARFCTELLRLLGADRECSVTLDENQVQVETEAGTITGRLVEGLFPKYEKVVPDYGHSLAMQRTTLAEIAKRAGVVADESANRIYMEFADDQTLRITAKSDDGAAEEEFGISGTLKAGQDPKLAVNFKLLVDAVQCCPDEDVQFFHEAALRPTMLHGQNPDQFLAVIMPMSLT